MYSSCFFHVWDLQHIRCYLDLDSAKLLATGLASSCLDYCNSLLYGIADSDLTKRIQNQLARLVTKSPPFTRSVPLLRSLHWLPVKFRIFFKISLLTYKTLHEKQFVYLHSMLAASLPSRTLRSNKGNVFRSQSWFCASHFFTTEVACVTFKARHPLAISHSSHHPLAISHSSHHPLAISHSSHHPLAISHSSHHHVTAIGS